MRAKNTKKIRFWKIDQPTITQWATCMKISLLCKNWPTLNHSYNFGIKFDRAILIAALLFLSNTAKDVKNVYDKLDLFQLFWNNLTNV